LLAIEDQLLPASSAPYGRASQAAAQSLMAKLYLNAEVYTGTPQWALAAADAATGKRNF
jgi:hypothetical protein